MPLTRDAVVHALSQVEDPDLKKDLVSLNMIRDLTVEEAAGGKVAFTLVLTTPACPLKDMLVNACKTAIRTLVDKDAQVEIEVTSEVTKAQAPPTPAGQMLPQVKNMIAVASGKGGVGKSTVAANLAIALSRTGAKVGLLDADIYGPSIPLMMGLVDAQPLVQEENGKQRMTPLQAHGVQVMSIGFLVGKDQAVVWRGPMASNAFRQLVADTAWEALDYLVVDLPPGTGDIQITLAQQFPLTGAIIVTTPQAVAVSDARKAAGMFLAPSINVPVLGVVENMAYFSPPDMPEKRYAIFGEGGGQALASEFEIPLLGQVPIEEAVRASGDAGTPAVLSDGATSQAFGDIAAKLAQQVAIRNAQPAVGANV